jgi:Polyketide synthase dehydratase
VVPAATLLTLMANSAEQTSPGRHASGLDDVRFHHWLVAAPPVEVPVRVRPMDRDRCHVAIGEYAEGVVILSDRYEGSPSAPWFPEPDERPATLRADQLYEDGWMFHGPSFQAVTAVLGIGSDGVRAELTVPGAPGGLMDGAGQVLGHWLIERDPERWIAFPAGIESIRFHGPQPPIGVAVRCAVRIRGLTDETVEADMRLTRDGLPLVTVTGWRDRRLESGGALGDVHRFTESVTVAEQQPDGWWLVAERWLDLASREFYLHKYLNAAERDEYQDCSPRARRGWLLRRIAVKDAVRGWLWEQGEGPIFPAELAVAESDDGHCEVSGVYGLSLPSLDVATASCHEVGVAYVRRSVDGSTCRIRVSEVSSDGADGADGADGDQYESTARIHNPAGLPPREYAVAWTPPGAAFAGPAQTNQGSP